MNMVDRARSSSLAELPNLRGTKPCLLSLPYAAAVLTSTQHRIARVKEEAKQRSSVFAG